MDQRKAKRGREGRRLTSGRAAGPAALGALLAATLALAAPSAGQPASGSVPPNVVVVMTDDQTVEETRVMERVRARIFERGATFVESFVQYPLCCPSRATFLTGQYARNHGVMDNIPPRGGYARLDDDETLPVWLQRRGYYTGHAGKYLNGYGNGDPAYVPPGWSEWYAPVAPGVDDVYGYDMNENGAIVHYGSSEQDYKQDVITRKALDFVARRAPAPEPFFLFVGYTAPHGAGPNPNVAPPADCDGAVGTKADDESGQAPPKPAPRHAGAFGSEPLPVAPSFNEADMSDKPPDMQDLPPLTVEDAAEVTKNYRCALAELLSVDEGVGQLLDALAASGELADTLVVFTSDNGFFFGEHRIEAGKKKLYEEAIRVPLAIRGPGVPAGTVVRDMAVNADLAPTILEATGAVPGLAMDGRSLLASIERPARLSGRELLIESNRYAAIRTSRYIYAEHLEGAVEMYDLEADPYQLRSVHTDPAYRQQRRLLAERLARLRRCAGERCLRAPKVELQLVHRSGERGEGRCAEPPVKAVVKRGGEAVESVSFRVSGGAPLESRHPPFRRRLPYARFPGGRATAVRATVDLMDGRRLTLAHSLTACG